MAGRNKALSLYRSILRAHDKFLPMSMRQLGDAYVKSEFRLHKSAKPEQAAQFFVEWEKYLRHVERTGRGNTSMDVGMVDRRQVPSMSSSPPIGSPDYVDGNNDAMRKNVLSFGKDVPADVALNEEQRDQLEKLREEAAKAGAEHG
eukprot:CAMPEP_0172541506 /NCGR_PEP_ID=MMETSP1067-20121228/12308_1 /TAXON_ID=265564 ORGANISM="Thalassiosira punctigera, Strain Tpunct2005C2" /NCGR_SAMPLE_ID=MMETSP1067 /ASSEMBLY_ACC=CAM_ASM_000444 /LENGTH=145 /DNA_ID=CAMNT_0013327563 /DNA_START=10 /DNA_END=447 /DNA_ORIENTATION=-